MDTRAITARELLDCGRGLFDAHHREVERDTPEGGSPSLPLVVDDDLFLAMDRAGVMLAFGLFDGKRMVGYAVATVTRHQYADAKVCAGAAVYIDPKWRRAGAASRLMTLLEETAASRHGACETHWHAKRGSAFEKLLERRGARELEVTYVARRS